MLEDKKENKDLSLRKVLDCLVKLSQHDILRAIPWQEGIGEYAFSILVCLTETYI